MSSLTLSGTPTSGEQCTVTVGSVTYLLAETGGDTLPQQAKAWADLLNATASFNSLYVALPLGDVVCLYAAAQTSSSGIVVTTTSSANMTLASGRLSAAITFTGVPTTGNHVVLDVAGLAYLLNETTGLTLAQQATAWAGFMNGQASFTVNHNAVASDAVLSIYYNSADVADNLPTFVNHSATIFDTLVAPPLAIGTMGLSGTPTGGESCVLHVGLLTFTLAQTSGFSLAQQARPGPAFSRPTRPSPPTMRPWPPGPRSCSSPARRRDRRASSCRLSPPPIWCSRPTAKAEPRPVSPEPPRRHRRRSTRPCPLASAIGTLPALIFGPRKDIAPWPRPHLDR